MKNEVLYLLLNNYADHEAVFLSSAIACDERCIKENPKYTNKVVAPTLDAVRSCSGFRTLPDYSFDTMPDDYAALVLIGGFGWLDEQEADKVVPIVRRADYRRSYLQRSFFPCQTRFLERHKTYRQWIGTIAIMGWKQLYQCRKLHKRTSRVRPPYCDGKRYRLLGICQRIIVVAGE